MFFRNNTPSPMSCMHHVLLAHCSLGWPTEPGFLFRSAAQAGGWLEDKSHCGWVDLVKRDCFLPLTSPHFSAWHNILLPYTPSALRLPTCCSRRRRESASSGHFRARVQTRAESLPITASLRRDERDLEPRTSHPNNLQERAKSDSNSDCSSRAAMPPSIVASSHGPAVLTRSIIPRLSAIYAIIRRQPSPYLSTYNALARRQSNTIAIIPSSYPGYPHDGPAPGEVAGIVLGAVGGFLLLIILLYYITNGGAIAGSIIGDDEIVVRRSRTRSPPRRSRKSQSHRSSRQEVRVVRSRSPRAQRITVEERTTIIPGPPPPRPMSVDERIVEERIVEERRPMRRVDGDDIVEVIEEGSSIVDIEPPRRDRRRRSSGYRSVDPNQFGGGDFPQRPIRTRRPS
jgi:hypothetical protein